MDKNYREFLERQLKEAQQEFEAVKASAITDLQGMQPYYAQDWGGGGQLILPRLIKLQQQELRFSNGHRH